VWWQIILLVFNNLLEYQRKKMNPQLDLVTLPINRREIQFVADRLALQTLDFSGRTVNFKKWKPSRIYVIPNLESLSFPI
jgi:hypothetical protein